MSGAVVTLDCPLRQCRAVVEVRSELRAPGSTERVHRIAEHRLVIPGAIADGQICPASLMCWPLNLAAVVALAESAQTIAAAAPELPDSELWFGSGRPQRHSLEPRPDPDARWFHGSIGMGSASYGRPR